MGITILGTKYRIIERKASKDQESEHIAGYCDYIAKKIVLLVHKNEAMNKKERKQCKKETLRHEILHAFLSESGLAYDSADARAWAVNEEMVDWFAMQAPKIYKTYKQMKLI